MLTLQILGPVATQEDVYEAAVRPIVEDVLKGYNGTIMAYGQVDTLLLSLQIGQLFDLQPRIA